VLTQRSSTNARFFSTRWQLWSVTLDSARTPLDVPPGGWADEAPTWSPAGDMLAFVRERKGYGTLVVLNRGIKRVASLGYSLGFYGHHDWELKWER
jgi:Tol biopolymer transport system component